MLVWDRALYETQYTGNGWPYGIRGSRSVPRFHYQWFAQRAATQAMVDRYITLPGFAQVSDVAIVGGGFGWTCELLAQHGINAISVDVSPYILATKDTSEEGELRDHLIAGGFDPDRLNEGAAGIRFMSPDDPNAWVDPWAYWLRPGNIRTAATVVDEDLMTNGSRRAVRQTLGNNIDAIVTEFSVDAMEAGDDASALALVENCEQLRPNPACTVIHLVGPNPNEVFLNVKPTEEWRALLDANGYTDHYVVDLRGNVLGPGG